MTVTAEIDNSAITFDSGTDGLSTETVFLKTEDGLLQWSTDGSTFSPDFDSSTSGDQTLAIQGSTDQAITVNGDDIDLTLQDLATQGASLDLDVESVTVQSGATVSTVLNSSSDGAVSFSTVTSISLDSGATLNAGDSAITLTVDQTLDDLQVNETTIDASITLTEATITGGDVQISISGDSGQTSGLGAGVSEFTFGSDSFLSDYSVVGGVAQGTATSEISIHGGSINAGSLEISADATVDSEVETVTIIVGIAVATAYPTATVTIDEGAEITTSGDFSVSTDANSTTNAKVTQFATNHSSTSLEKYNFAVAVAVGEINSTITLGDDASVTSGGTASFSSTADKEIAVGALAAAGRQGTLGLGFALSEVTSTVEANVNGQVVSSGNVDILAELSSTTNTTSATGAVGESSSVSELKASVVGAFKNFANFARLGSVGNLFSKVESKLGRNQADATRDNSGSGGFSFAFQTNDVTAQIGDGASVESTDGGVTVEANSTDRIKNKSTSTAAASRTGKNTRAKQLSLAVGVGELTNNATAAIGRDATVTAAGDIVVEANTRVPWEQQYYNWSSFGDGFETIVNKINTNFGIEEGLFTTWAEATVGKTEDLSVGASFMVFVIDGSSDAFIGEGATVESGGQTSVLAFNENDTVNSAGQLISSLPLPEATKMDLKGAASRGTGVGGSIASMTYTNHATAKIKGDAIVNTDALLVMARGDERNVSVAAQGGKADGKYAINGAGNLLILDTLTLAQIDSAAQVTVGDRDVQIPRDYDTIDLSGEGFFSDLPQFDPFDQIDGTVDDPIYRVDLSDNQIELPYDHGFEDGQLVYYSNGGGVDIGGLNDGTAYVVQVVDDHIVRLAEIDDDTGSPITFNLDATEGSAHSLLAGFAPSDVDTDPSEDGVEYAIEGLPDYWVNNRPVAYFIASDATAFPTLNVGQTYYLSVDDSGGMQLLDAPDGNVISIDPTQASGTHFLVPTQEGNLVLDNPLRALDSNGDGEISTSDDHISNITTDNYVTDLSLVVIADDYSAMYSGTGGITRGRSVGVGIALGVTVIDRQTSAIIGDLERELSATEGQAVGVGVDSEDAIYLGYNHGFSQSDLVTYAAGGDFPIGGLRDGESYYVNIDADSDNSGDSTIKLARSVLEALEDVSTLFSASDVSSSLGSDSIDLGYEHGFQLGDWVRFSAGSGDAIGGLDEETNYYVIPLSSTEIALAESQALANEMFLEIFNPRDTVSDDTLVFAHDHSFVAGQRLIYSAGGGTEIGGLSDGQVVVVSEVVDEFTISLETLDGTAISLDASSSVGQTHALQPGFLGTSSAVSTTNELDLGYTYSLNNGDLVYYTAVHSSTTPTPITGLTSGQVYYVVSTDATSMRLASTEELAEKARWWYFDSTSDLSDTTDDSGTTSSTITFAQPHPYVLNDELVYTITDFYEDPTSETIEPLQYVDPTDGTTKTLAEGQTVYAIPAVGLDVVDMDAGEDTTIYFGLQIALEPDGQAIQLINTDSAGIHGFRSDASAVQISAVSDTGTTHFLQSYQRVDLDASDSSGQDYAIRLALDPSSATKATHGLGRTFDPDTAIGGSGTSINLGYTHGFQTGDAVVYSNGRGTSIDGIGHGNVYYVVSVDETTIQLTKTAEDATSDDPDVISLNSDVATGSLHGFGLAFDANPIVDSPTNTIHFGHAHGFDDGDSVVYQTNGGAAIGGLTDGQVYTVQLVGDDGTSLQLLDADGDVIDLDGTLATGTSQSLGDLLSDAGFVTVAGEGLVSSHNDGEIISLALASVLPAPKVAGNDSNVEVDNDNNADDDADADVGDDDVADEDENNNARSAMAAAASFAINVVADTTYAYIKNTDFVATGLTLSAINTTTIDTGTGAISIATQGDDPEGLAGAFSINVVANVTRALIEDATVNLTAGELDVAATNTSNIVAVAMGLAGSSGSFDLAGSVVFNVVDSDALALIKGSTINVSDGSLASASGDVSVQATSTNTILAIAGAFSGSVASSGTSSNTGVGVAVAFNLIVNPRGSDDDPSGTAAIISDTDLSADGVIDVSASTDNTIDSVAAAIAFAFGGKSTALAFSFSVNTIAVPTRAAIRRSGDGDLGVSGDEGVWVSAQDDSSIVSVAGDVSLAGDSANGFALSLNVTRNLVVADATDTTVTSSSGDVRVTAHATPIITSIAAGGTVSEEAARQGSFSVVVTTNTTHAYITGSSTEVMADGSVLVSASDRSKIFSLGGSIVVSGVTGESGQPLSSVGIANSTLVTVNSVTAAIEEDVTVQANGNQTAITGYDQVGVLVSATSDDTITTIAAGAVLDVASSNISIAGSATVTVLTETTEAWIGDGAQINLATSDEGDSQDVVVTADETTTLFGVAGAADVSIEGTGVGAGVDVSVITKHVEAWLGLGADVEATGDVIVQATSHEDATSITGTIAVGASQGAIAGSVGVSTYDITTKAEIQSSSASQTTVDAGGSVLVAAEERTEMVLVNADFAASAEDGIGGSIGIPVVIKTTEATIGDSAIVDALGGGDGLTVNTGTFETFSGDTSHSGLVDSLDLGNSSLPIADKGYLENSNATPEQLTAFRGVAVTAVNSDQIELYNVGASASSEAAVQVSLGVNDLNVDTTATIGSSAQINQTAASSASADDDQSVHVAAGADFFTRSILGGLSVSGNASATPGVGVAYVTMDTEATIGESADVDAVKNVHVFAHNSEDMEVVGIAVAGTSGELAAAGSFAVIDLNNTTIASIGDSATIDAGGNVTVMAQDLTDSDIIAGAAGVAAGGGGVGVSVGLSLISKETRAFIGDGATVDAKGQGDDNTFDIRTNDFGNDGSFVTESLRGVGVSAYTVEDMFAGTAAGAGGVAVGLAGAITWQQIDSDTRAYIDRNALINTASDNSSAAHANQDVAVTAFNQVTATGFGGAIDGGAFGFGAAVDIGTIANVTEAAILADVDDDDTSLSNSGEVFARNDVRAEAGSDRSITSLAASAGGGTFALQVGLSLWTIGDRVSANYDVDGQTQSPISGIDSSTEDVGNDTTDVDAGYEGTGSNNQGDNSDSVATNVGTATDRLGSFTDLLIFGDTLVSGTNAYFGANGTVNAGDEVSAISQEQSSVTSVGGALAAGVVGAGAGVAIANIASKAEATIEDGAIVTAGGDLTIHASADESTSNYAVAGSAGYVAVAAQYAESDVKSVQSASIGAGVQILEADAVTVEAAQTRDLHAFTAGAEAGTIGVAGFAGTLVVGGGTVEAVVAENAQIGTASQGVGSVAISATSTTEQAKAETYAVGGGLGLAVEAGSVQAKVDPTVQAATLDSVQIYAEGDVSVGANASAVVESYGYGVEIAAGVAGGSMSVLSVVSPTIVAELGSSNTVVSGGDVTVNAEQTLVDDNQSAYAYGFGVSASLFLSIAGVSAKATSETSATAIIGADSNVTAASGTVTVESGIANDLGAVTDGGSGGGISASGSNVSVIDVTTTSVAIVDDGVSITAETLEIVATGTDTADGQAANNKFSFGFTSTTNNSSDDLFASQVDITINSTTSASIGDNTSTSQAIDVTTLKITADHENVISGSAEDVSVGIIAGLGGAGFGADLDATVSAAIGEDVVANAETIAMTAGNTSGLAEDSTGFTEAVDATSATGGVGASAKVVNEIDVDHVTTATIGEGAQVNADYSLVGSPSAVAGGVDIEASNDANLLSTANLGAASLLGASTNAQATIDLGTYEAIAAVGDDAVLKSSGEISLATLSNANLRATTNAIGKGLFVGTKAVGSSTVDADNEVRIGSGATIESEDDVNLLAGQIGVLENVGDPVPALNSFTLNGSTDAYATDQVSSDGGVSATASVDQTNEVTIAEDATVRAVSDAYFLTDAGVVLTEASASFQSVTGSLDSTETETDDANNLVVVDGDVEVGLFNRRTLEFDSDANPISDTIDTDAITIDANTDMDQTLEDRINTMVQEAAYFSGTSMDEAFEEQRTFWTDLVAQLGGNLEFVDGEAIVSEIVLPTASILDVYVTSGNIYVEGKNLRGSGSLTAPTDTTIEVVNNSNLTLDFSDLTIPDRPGGQVRLNRVRVDGVEAVKALNTNSSLDSLVDITFNFSYETDSTADADTEPLISVTNVPVAGEEIDANLFFNGDVTNRSGDVDLDGGDGSVLVNGGMTAGSLAISSGGDFVFGDSDTDGDGFFHVGGDPFDLYFDVAGANEAADSQVSDVTEPIAGTTGSVSDDAGSTIVAGNVLITAENININGIIQSGIPYHTVTISDPDGDLDSVIQAATDAYEAADASDASDLRYVTLDSKYLSSATGNASDDLFDSISDTLVLQWDAQEQTLILVGEIEVRGGFMQLTANRIINSSGGELRVLDGYGTIDIANETDLPITLSNLDVGSGTDDAEGIEGTIILTEKARHAEAASGQSALITVFTRADDQVTVTTNSTVDSSGNPASATTTAGDTVTYTPLEGTRYQWVSAGTEGTIQVYELNGRSSKPTFDEIVTEDNLVSETDDGRSDLTSRGSVVTVDTEIETDIYTYEFSEIVNSVYNYWYDYQTRHINALTRKVESITYDERITRTIGTRTTHINSVKADYPITVTFLGDSGAINVDSLGSVIVGGSLSAPGGQVTINAGVDTSGEVTNDAATIESSDSDGVIEANQIDLNAPGGIGTDGPVYFDQTSADDDTAVVATSDGDISLSSASDVVTLSSVVAGTDSLVTIEATAGAIAGVSGTSSVITAGSIDLTAASDVGTADQSLNIDTGGSSDQTLTLNAGNDAYVREVEGDLYVSLIEAVDVSLFVDDGSLLDATAFEGADRDAATIDDLVSLWESLGLINDAAEDRKALILSDAVSLHNYEYEQYWTQRSAMDDPTDPSSFDFQFSDEKVERMLELGYTSVQISNLESSATARFLELNDVYGPGGTYVTNNDTSYDPDTFDTDFDYQLTDDEIADLTADLAFTEDGLLWNLSTGVTDRTDTTAFDESPNIIAQSISVVASDAVGDFSEGVIDIAVTDGDIADIADDDDNTRKIELLSADPEDLAFYLQETDENLVAAWQLDEDAGSTYAKDSTGNGHGGAVTLADFGVGGAIGATGTSAEFDGSGRVKVPYDAALNPDSFTVSVWARPTGGSGYRSVITSRLGSGPRLEGYVLYLTPSNQWEFWTGTGSSSWVHLNAGDAELDAWTHLAISFDADTNTKTIYVNGEATSTTSQAYAPNQSEDFHIGAGGTNGTTFHFVGGIDDVGVFDTALDQTSIQALMADGITVDRTPWSEVDDGDGIVEADEYNLIELTLREDVNLASTDTSIAPIVSATASGGVLLGSTNDLSLNQIDAGTGEVRIKVDGGIINEAGTGVANITAGNLIIEAAGASIGSLALPVTFDLSGALTVRGEFDAYLESVANADQDVNLLTAVVGDVFGLTAPGAIVDANDPTDSSGNQIAAVANVIAGAVRFSADTVGTSGNPIEVELDSGGALSGFAGTSLYVDALGALLIDDLNSNSGVLHVTAVDDMYLGLIENTEGSVTLASTTGSILNNAVDGLDLLVPDVDLSVTASDATIGTEANPLEILQGASVTVSGPSVDPDDYAFYEFTSPPLGVFDPGEEIGGGGSFVHLDDFDGDGYLDVLTSLNGVTLMLNDQDGTFTSQGVVATGNIFAALPGEFNGDGYADFLLFNIDSSYNFSAKIYLNDADGTGALTLHQTIDLGILHNGQLVADNFVELVDLDNDSFIDFTVYNPEDKTIVQYRNNRSGTFSEFGAITLPTWWRDSDSGYQFAELTGDDNLDLILGPGPFHQVVAVIPNEGNWTFSEDRAAFTTDSTVMVDQQHVNTVTVGDVDGDGLNDLVFGVQAEFSGSNGSYTSYVVLNQGFGVVPDDLFAFPSDGFSFEVDSDDLLGSTRLIFSFGEALGDALYPQQINLVDLDLDGDLDALIESSATPPDQAYLYEDGSFTATGQILTGSSGSGAMAVGDLDNDADQDVIFANQIWLQRREPIIASDQSFFFAENRIAGETFYTVVTLPTTEVVTFNLEQVTNGGVDVTENWAIDGDTGVIGVVDPSRLDYESVDNHNFLFTITITSVRGGTDTKTVTGTMLNLDRAEVLYASFNDDLTNYNIDENSEAGTAFDVSGLADDNELELTIGRDDDGNLIQIPGDRIVGYEITGGTTGYGQFTIDDDGTLTFAGSNLSYEDYPDDQKYIDLYIQAFDTEGNTQGPGTVRMHINNLYEGPTFLEVPGLTADPTLEFDAADPGDDDGVWDSTTDTQDLNYTLGEDVTLVTVTSTNIAGITTAYEFPGANRGDSSAIGGTSSYETLLNDPSEASMSLEIWFKPDDLTTSQVLWESGGNQIGSSFVITEDADLGETVLRFIVKDFSSALVVQTPLDSSATEDFLQATATLELNGSGTSTLSLYLNGALVDTSSGTGISDWTGSDNSGLGGASSWAGGSGTTEAGDLNTSYESFNGQVAIVRFYESTLSSTQVNNNYLTILNDRDVTVDEASTATLTQTFDSLGTLTTDLTASVGTIVDNEDGTWTWSYTPTDGPDDSQTVTLTSTEPSGLSVNAEFALEVDDVAPTIELGESTGGVDGSVLVGPNLSGSYTGTYSDVGDDVVTITSDLGSIDQGDDGTWTWSLDYTDDSLDGETVTVTATDSDGEISTVQFTIDIDDVAPDITPRISPARTLEGSTVTVSDSILDADALELEASIGTIVDDGSGNWVWTNFFIDGDETVEIVITATDPALNETTFGFALDVINVNPTVELSLTETTIEEGGTTTLRISDYVDPGTDTVTQILVDWGDGETTTLDRSDDPFTSDDTVSLDHAYADGNANYTILVNLIDEDGFHVAGSITVAVENASPSITSFDVPSSTATSSSDDDDSTVLSTTNAVSPDANAPFPSAAISDLVLPSQTSTTSSAAPLATAPSSNAPFTVASEDDGPFRINETLILSASASDPAGDDDPLHYAWTIDEPDGTQLQLTGETVEYTPNTEAAGTHYVTLTVTDDDGGTASQTGTIEVEASPIVDDAGGPYTVVEGQAIVLDEASASDPNQDAATLTYLWDLDGDGLFGETGDDALYGDEVGISPTFEAPVVDDVDSLEVTLRVLDDLGFSTDATTTISILNAAPTIEAQSFLVTEEASVGTSLGVVVADDLSSESLSFAITGGSGQSVFAIDPTTGELSVQDADRLVHSEASSYTLEVEVTDDEGATASATMSINVEDVASLEATFQQGGVDVSGSRRVEPLTIRFTEATNVQELIDSGAIKDAVQLVDSDGNTIDLGEGDERFSYDASTHTLSIDLSYHRSIGWGPSNLSLLSPGESYALQLDPTLITEADGSHTLIESDGTNDGSLTFAFVNDSRSPWYRSLFDAAVNVFRGPSQRTTQPTGGSPWFRRFVAPPVAPQSQTTVTPTPNVASSISGTVGTRIASMMRARFGSQHSFAGLGAPSRSISSEGNAQRSHVDPINTSTPKLARTFAVLGQSDGSGLQPNDVGPGSDNDESFLEYARRRSLRSPADSE